MDTPLPSIPFDNSYARLPEGFFARLDPTPVASPRLLHLNAPLARALGLDPMALASTAGVEVLAGNDVPGGAEPLAMAYAGHQFGNWVPQLGDGRAILLGEVVDVAGVRQDIQLKGAGRTPFSRGGDGRAWAGPVLREYVVSEAMGALGVPTTRALAAVATGEPVLREDGPLPGAVLTRIARSHVRVGTFQYFTARRDEASVRALAAHVTARHYPDTLQADRPALALLDAVVRAQAALVAHWQSIGFVHGVMNTDNCSISGDTIDYGPCAFLDDYHPESVFSAIDVGGRYAYANQPHLAQWNVANFAQCLLPMMAAEEVAASGATDDAATGTTSGTTTGATDGTADGTTDGAEADYSEATRERVIAAAQASVDRFETLFAAERTARFRAKLGLADERDDDVALIDALLETMDAGSADFTLTFRTLEDDPAATRALFAEPEAFDVWHARWRERVADDPRGADARRAAMRATNPAVVPRNHTIERMIRAFVEDDDLAPLEELLATLSDPFSASADDSALARPPAPAERVTRTFCGT